MRATRMNQRVSMSLLDSAIHVMPDKKKKQNRKYRVHSHKPQQGKQAVPRRYLVRKAGIRAHQSVDEPWLPSQFCGQPARRIRDKRKWETKHHNPEHPSRFKQPPAPKQEGRRDTDGNEDGSETHHDVVAVIQEWNVVGPSI